MQRKRIAMADYRYVLDEDDLTPGLVTIVTLEGHVIALTLLDGSPRAFQSLCPHERASLAGGRIEGCELHCPRHFARFDLNSGAVSAGWQVDDLKLYPARTVGGRVEVDADAVRQSPPEGQKTVWDFTN